MSNNGEPPRAVGRRGAMRGAGGGPPAPGGRGIVPMGQGRGRGRGVPPPTVTDADKKDKGKVSPTNGKTSPGKKSPTGAERAEAEMNKLAISAVELKQRPGIGQAGRRYEIKANHFALHIGDEKNLVVVEQYNVEVIHPRRKLIKEERRVAFWKCVVENKQIFGVPLLYAYDGDHICFTVQPKGGKIDFQNGQDEREFALEGVMFEREDRPASATVRFRHVGTVSLDLKTIRSGLSMGELQTPIQAVDVIFRQTRTCTYITDQPFVCGGRSFYRPPRNYNWADLGYGRQIWTGYFASAHVASNWKPLMNVDTSNTAYYATMPVLKFLCEVLHPWERRRQTEKFVERNFNSSYSLSPEEKQQFQREIRDLRIVVTHTGGRKVYKVNGVTDLTASQIKFTKRLQDGSEVETNVAQYFQDTYGRPLNFPHMQCLHVGSKRKQIYMPMELCDIKDSQKCAKKLVDTMLAKMIKNVCTDAPTRERAIMEQVTEAKLGEDEWAKQFGLAFEPRMVQFQARQLEPLTLTYGQNRTTKPMSGEWKMNGLRFHQGSQIRNYWLFSLLPPNRQRELEGFCVQLNRVSQGMGTELPQYPSEVQYIQNMDGIKDAFALLKKVKDKDRPDLIVVAIPNKGHPSYPVVKRQAEIVQGVMTQCVTTKTVCTPSPPTLANIVLKINAKMGGVNNGIGREDPAFIKMFMEEPTIVLGVDVTHPGPLDTRTPSIASMVGNIELEPYKYAASIKVQRHAREALVYLGDLVKDRLMAFFKVARVKPSRIIVYRDGVSEGQFKQVMLEEMRGIRTACSSLDESYRPKITFIVVQKRHHTRFFCANPRDMSGRAKNVPPGTVVDTDVVHPVNFDFFMVSHQGLLGTSRPSHYFILHDDNDFSADVLQRGTFLLTHVYCRCLKSVSIPAPVYYAHLACSRAKHHLQEKINERSSDSGSQSGDRRGGRAAAGADGSGEPSSGEHSGGSVSTQEQELREAVLVVDNSADIREGEQPLHYRMYFA